MITFKNKHLHTALTSFLFFALISATGLTRAYAANLDIYCDDNADDDQCHVEGSPSLFNETGWYPGSTSTKTISVLNGDHNDDCRLIMYATDEKQSPAGFAGQLNTAIKKDGKLIYGGLDGIGGATGNKTLQNVFDGDVGLDVIPPKNGSANYEWILTFNKAADSTFANAYTNFSFNVEFKCNHDKSTYNPSSNNGGGRGGVAGAATGVTNVFRNIFAGGAVAGAEVEAETPKEEPKKEEVKGVSNTVPVEAVKGAASEVCTVSGFLWLAFVAQFLFHILAKFLFKKGRTFYVSQLVTMTVFVAAFFIYFCVWWDVLVSVLIGILSIYIMLEKYPSKKQYH